MPPSAVFRTQSSRNAVKFEVREALVESGSAVISGVGRKCHSSVDDRRWTSTVNICKCAFNNQKRNLILFFELTDTFRNISAPCTVFLARDERIADDFVTALASVLGECPDFVSLNGA